MEIRFASKEADRIVVQQFLNINTCCCCFLRLNTLFFSAYNLLELNPSTIIRPTSVFAALFPRSIPLIMFCESIYLLPSCCRCFFSRFSLFSWTYFLRISSFYSDICRKKTRSIYTLVSSEKCLTVWESYSPRLCKPSEQNIISKWHCKHCFCRRSRSLLFVLPSFKILPLLTIKSNVKTIKVSENVEIKVFLSIFFIFSNIF